MNVMDDVKGHNWKQRITVGKKVVRARGRADIIWAKPGARSVGSGPAFPKKRNQLIQYAREWECWGAV